MNVFHRAKSIDMERVLGTEGSMRACPYCGSDNVAICQMKDTLVECLDCNAEGPPIRRKRTDNPEEAAYLAIKAWRGKDPEPKFELTKTAMSEAIKKAEIDMRLVEIMMIVEAEWSSDPHSVKCFDLRIVKETKDLLAERKGLWPGFG